MVWNYFSNLFFFVHWERKWLLKAGKYLIVLNFKTLKLPESWILVRNYEYDTIPFDLSCISKCLFLLASARTLFCWKVRSGGRFFTVFSVHLLSTKCVAGIELNTIERERNILPSRISSLYHSDSANKKLN